MVRAFTGGPEAKLTPCHGSGIIVPGPRTMDKNKNRDDKKKRHFFLFGERREGDTKEAFKAMLDEKTGRITVKPPEP